MTVPTVPTVPTSNREGWNGPKAQFSAGYSPAVPTVPTFFIMKEKKEYAPPCSTVLCICGPDICEFRWNGWNGPSKPQNSAPCSRSIPGTLGWNGSLEVGTA